MRSLVASTSTLAQRACARTTFAPTSIYKNISMKYLNVSLSVLRGGHHPDLSNIKQLVKYK